MNISIDARSDQSFEVTTNSSNSSLILDNENPVIIDSIPSNQDYLDSEQDRELSLLIGDVSGFNVENMNLQIWVQGMDDGSDGSFPDGYHKPVSTETLTSHWRMRVVFGGLMELNPMMQTKTSNWYTCA